MPITDTQLKDNFNNSSIYGYKYMYTCTIFSWFGLVDQQSVLLRRQYFITGSTEICRTFNQEYDFYIALQDSWSLMALVFQDSFQLI